MSHCQDFVVVDIGHGKQNINHRENARKGNTISVHKPTFVSNVSKQIQDTTEALPTQYCDGKDIVQLRTSKNMKQKDLAKIVNEKMQTIQQLEQGRLVATPENKRIINKIKQRLIKM